MSLSATLMILQVLNLGHEDLRINIVFSTSTGHTSRLMPDLHECESDGLLSFDCSFVNDLQIGQRWQVQISEGMGWLSDESKRRNCRLLEWFQDCS